MGGKLLKHAGHKDMYSGVAGMDDSEIFDLEILSESFLDELENIKDFFKDISDYELNEEDEEESEYREVYGDVSDELKEYQEKFSEYAEKIKKGLERMYGGEAVNSKSGKNPEDVNPFERGHKPGCGCPGCTAYEKKRGLRAEDSYVNQSSESDFDLKLASASKSSKKNKYVENETGDRPCKGKLYNHFHGEKSGLKNVLGNYTKRFNFSPAGY